jgi:transposase
MWTPEHRRAGNRNSLRYPSDWTDGEWSIVAPMIPPARHGGRKRSVNVRDVLNGIFYVLWTGCQWKALPKDLPPKSTVHDYEAIRCGGLRGLAQTFGLSSELLPGSVAIDA